MGRVLAKILFVQLAPQTVLPFKTKTGLFVVRKIRVVASEKKRIFVARNFSGCSLSEQKRGILWPGIFCDLLTTTRGPSVLGLCNIRFIAWGLGRNCDRHFIWRGFCNCNARFVAVLVETAARISFHAVRPASASRRHKAAVWKCCCACTSSPPLCHISANF